MFPRAQPRMNIHHLELFYYVARHRGISSAVRAMPYGIQQPAVSSQIQQLERDLGTRLFERNPFRLTRSGEELFDFIRPFFSNLDAVAQRIGKRSAPTARRPEKIRDDAGIAEPIGARAAADAGGRLPIFH